MSWKGENFYYWVFAAFLSTYGGRGKMPLIHGDPMDRVIP